MQIHRTTFGIVSLIVIGLAAAPMALAAEVDYGRVIRPILSKNCFACHGPDESSRQANMRLDQRKSAIGEDGSHPAITPGDSANSRVVARITHPDMPMPPTGQRLSPEEIDLIKRWIDEGAHYNAHWAFEAPERPELPEIKKADWPRNEIDRFVLERLEKEGLTPSPEADRYTLIRRLSFDLTGLPPTPGQVRTFVHDKSPDAYEKVVDELLASPHYGERWARVWLDLARYADSKGYEADRLRTIWPYRDWVIRALNKNMPFDKFTVAQLAGDLLPVMSIDQLVATGFHRNTMTNDEGGTDNEEYRDMAIKDRVATTGQVWMGLTWGCAQCHSHKYDPLSHNEFYQLYAFFNQTADADLFEDTPKLELEDDVTTLVMRELPPDQQRVTRIHQRGSFMDPGEEVEPAVPAVFPSLPEDAPRNRLGLARWLVDENNPLTARVTVNRFWARIFGTGIVESEEDFGNQGALPTHPRLLDWMATEFMRLDWDMKAIQKKIVMSATYRQSSDADKDAMERDPRNRLLSRGPRIRLAAEMVRDQMLAVSGLLSKKMYGDPVMPLQPDGVWQVVYDGYTWETSAGEDRYRRALYTLWRRTSPYPSMITFDAPTGEVCTLRRVPTNTPLQALVTLNDPLSLEAAQHLAEQVLEETGGDVDKMIEKTFFRTLARPPSADEVGRLRKLYEQSRQDLQNDTISARKLLHVDRVIYESDRERTVFPLSSEERQVWRYTIEQPSPEWNRPDFDASSWTEAPGLFGRIREKQEKEDGEDEAEKKPERTQWESERIWMRREFDLDGAPIEKLQALVNFRGGFEVFINGVRAATSDDDISGDNEIDITPDALAGLHPGRNVIAVTARRTIEGDGDQYIDVGLKSVLKPHLGEKTASDAGRAAAVMVAHVLLNLDETLTKR